jgi:hypothetical protein
MDDMEIPFWRCCLGSGRCFSLFWEVGLEAVIF